MITATGLGSGLDISGLVSQLVAAERAPLDAQLNRQGARLNSKFSALGTLKSAISGFQSSLGGLNVLGNYGKYNASSSVPEEIAVTATDQATAGTYAVSVSNLATTHSLASAAVVDKDTTAIGTGSITFRFGTTDYISGSDTYNSFALNSETSITTIDITSDNNTLEGIMTAINDADIGVEASIVNDGTGYRLLMSNTETGATNSMEVSVIDDDMDNIDTSGLSMFAFNSAATNITQTAEAVDAQLTINGLDVSSASNTIDFAIEGVSFTIKDVTTADVKLSIAKDTASVISSVNGFISGYNSYIATVNKLRAYDADKDIPGPLLGDFTVRAIDGQIDRFLKNTVSGLTGPLTSLSAIGISTTSSGTLTLDSGELGSLLDSDAKAISKIFAAFGDPSDADITYSAATSKTTVGDYAVDITSLATIGFLTGAGVLPNFALGGPADKVDIDANNDNFTISVDGIDAGEITLTTGAYTTGESLASEIQSRINGVSALSSVGKTVNVVYDNINNTFSINSDSYGTLSTVEITAVDVNTAADLGFSVASGTAGANVEGTIGGFVATGTGNVLTADSGNDPEGLSVIVEGLTTGSRGTVNFTRGLSDQLGVYFSEILISEGALDKRITTTESRLEEVVDKRESLELRWQKIEERYLRQFNSLDILLSGLQSTSTYLDSQFENLLTPFTGSRS